MDTLTWGALAVYAVIVLCFFLSLRLRVQNNNFLTESHINRLSLMMRNLERQNKEIEDNVAKLTDQSMFMDRRIKLMEFHRNAKKPNPPTMHRVSLLTDAEREQVNDILRRANSAPLALPPATLVD